jgi:hypothetical protein
VQYVLIFSTVQFSFYVTNNLDRGHEKRTMNSCAFASQSYSARSRPELGPQSEPAKSLFQNTLRVSCSLTILCGEQFGVLKPKHFTLKTLRTWVKKKCCNAKPVNPLIQNTLPLKYLL